MVVIPPQDPVSAPWGFFEWATSSLVALFGIVLGFVVKTVTQLNNHKAQLKNLDEKLEKQEIINKSNVEELQEIKDRISGKSGKGETEHIVLTEGAPVDDEKLQSALQKYADSAK